MQLWVRRVRTVSTRCQYFLLKRPFWLWVCEQEHCICNAQISFFFLMEFLNDIITLINRNYLWGNFWKRVFFPNSIGFLKTLYKFIFFPFRNPKPTMFLLLLCCSLRSYPRLVSLLPIFPTRFPVTLSKVYIGMILNCYRS